MMCIRYAFFAALLALGCSRPEMELEKKTRVLEIFRAQPQSLAAVQKRAKLRAIISFNSMQYFIDRADEMGFEYSLAEEFANWLGVDLEIVLPPTPSAAYTWLADGGADLIIMPHRLGTRLTPNLTLSAPYAKRQEALVVSSQIQPLQHLSEVKGREILVIKNSPSHLALLAKAREQGVKLSLRLLPEDHDDSELLRLMANGKADLVAMDHDFANSAIRAKYHQFRVALDLNQASSVAWVVPQHSQQLKMRLDQFIDIHYHPLESGEIKRSAFYNLLNRKYYQQPMLSRFQFEDTSNQPTVSQYDSMIRRIADEYGLDWRFLLAVMYEESKFDANAVSRSGAKGLMQLMPSTFATLGFAKIFDTEENLRAGAIYLRKLLRSYDQSALQEDEKLRFVLAGYNAGRNHLEDARRLAEMLGWQKDSWHGGIKQALKLLTDARYYKLVPYGYCRGGETTHYVRRIMDRYSLFKKILVV